jgi:serine/threonine protein kinase
MAKIGRYDLVAQLASGNTGYVYSARAPEARPASGMSRAAPGDLVALKLIKPRLANDQRYTQLLFTEAPGAVAFSHPNAVRILEIDRVDEDLFIAMELVEGRTLAQVLERSIADRRPLSPELVFSIAASAASALASAHRTHWSSDEARGMYHGEVSPQSILITWEGTVKLVGVGVGRSRICLPPARARLPYRAPELFARSTVDAANDVYGLGVVLYEGLTHKGPFARDEVGDTRQAILDNVFMPLAVERPDLPPAVDELVARMMAREPADRPEQMAQIEHALKASLANDDEVLSQLLAEEMRVLFVEELSEAAIDNEVGEPWELKSPFRKIRALTPPPRPAGLGTPPPAVLSESSPTLPLGPHPKTAKSQPRNTGIYDEFDVDQLVDAIVAASSSSKAPIVSVAAPRRTPLPPPIEVEKVPRSATPFAKALDENASEFEIDQLVDAIVHASAKARQSPSVEASPSRPPAPGGGPTPAASRKRDPIVVKEAFHAGAIVDVALERRAKKPAPAREPFAEAPVDTSSDATFLQSGDLVGNRYRVIGKIGVGGMSVVYRVEHVHLQKLFALKLLRPELSAIPYVVQRFQREARCVSQLDHPHVVRVTDFGRADNGSLYLVMELLEGRSLTQKLEGEAPFSLDLALSIMEQLLLGLEHAHRNRVIHRDLKPDNVMLLERDGTVMVKIVDFGIAKLANDEMGNKPITQAGMVFGSPRYMSPEQANGEELDHRADLYAAAIILYEMLTGFRPFEGKNANAVFSKLLTQPPPPMNLANPSVQVGQRVEQVILRALSKEIDERYPTAGEFWEALRTASRP